VIDTGRTQRCVTETERPRAAPHLTASVPCSLSSHPHSAVFGLALCNTVE